MDVERAPSKKTSNFSVISQYTLFVILRKGHLAA